MKRGQELEILYRQIDHSGNCVNILKKIPMYFSKSQAIINAKKFAKTNFKLFISFPKKIPPKNPLNIFRDYLEKFLMKIVKILKKISSIFWTKFSCILVPVHTSKNTFLKFFLEKYPHNFQFGLYPYIENLLCLALFVCSIENFFLPKGF